MNIEVNPTGRLFRILGHSGYRFLTIILIAQLILLPLMYDSSLFSSIVGIIFILPYLVGLYVLRLQKGLFWSVAYGLGVTSILMELITYWFVNPYLIAASFAIFALYLILISFAILHDIFSQSSFSADAIYGSICVYLLLGMIWALLYSLAFWQDPSSFVHNSVFTPIASAIGTPEAYFPRFLYFSLVTLTTLGYGDVAPGNLLGSMLTSLEAVVGQLYVAILIARLVGLTSFKLTSPDEEHSTKAET